MSSLKQRTKAISDPAKKAIIEEELRSCGGVVAEAARRLDVPVRTLWHHISELGINVDAIRAGG